MKMLGYPLPERISTWLEEQKNVGELMEQEYVAWKNNLEAILSELEKDQRYYEQLVLTLKESLALDDKLSKRYSREVLIQEFNRQSSWTYSNFINQVLKPEKNGKSEDKVLLNICADYREIINILGQWIELETKILSYEKEMMDKKLNASKEKAKEVLEAVNKITKRKKEIDISEYYFKFRDEELKKFNETLNEMLRQFHFPRDFLPINVVGKKKGRGRLATYGYTFSTGGSKVSRVNFNSLSTGQKSIVYFCWTIALNYSLKNKTHNLMFLDDITTSLDLAQLLSVAKIVRQVAYGLGLDKRQVFITCHHEDFSNRLLDYLIPPPGNTLKLIRLFDLRNGKPVMEQYSINTTGDFNKKKNEFLNIIKIAKME